jgi:hypothetical protein
MTTCDIPTCDQPVKARNVCAGHYQRLRATGDCDPDRPLGHKTRSKHHTRGYVWTWAKGHPLAARGGRVLEHRLVLWEKIGPGTHPCHHCGCPVAWFPTPGEDRLVVDHLDDDQTNNDPSNVEPSCQGCNVTRSRWPEKISQRAARCCGNLRSRKSNMSSSRA